jgi:hypothetical protein
MRRMLHALIPLVTLTSVASASAAVVAPVVMSVSSESRHPVVAFSAPKATDVTLEVATAPGRATNGAFFAENYVTSEFFTSGEIVNGRWMSPTRYPPGVYWVMLNASSTSYDCEPTLEMCARGRSDVVSIVVPEPPIVFASALTLTQGTVVASLNATPLGERRSYRLCWRNRRGAERCRRGSLGGTSWDNPAADEIALSTRSLRRTTRFRWYVKGRLVASRTVRVRMRT